MLDELHIQNVALIREATFRPSAGLSVITGETGSGKTALLSAVKLLMGQRMEASLVREGETQACVEGRFFFDGAACAPDTDGSGFCSGMSASGGSGDDAGVVVSRSISTQARSRACINGSLASLKEVNASIGARIDLCGQHEHQRLFSPAYQRSLIDAWAGESVAVPLAVYRECLGRVAAAEAELHRLEALNTSAEVELNKARFVVEQITAINPYEGEYEELLERLPRLEHAELLIQQAIAAHTSLTASGGVLEGLENTLNALSAIAHIDASLEHEVNTVRESYFELEEVARTLASYRTSVDFPQEELEEVQNRIAELQGLMRGFGPGMKEVFVQLEAAQKRLREYDGRDELIAAAKRERNAAEQALLTAAHELQQAREQAVPAFLSEVNAQMALLEMGGACLSGQFTELERCQWNEWGPCRFELMFAASSSLTPQRLAKVASGGEISRVMLAIKVVLGTCDEAETLVFDEVDAGIGGSAAAALAAVLEQLAQTHQVIVVTHLPQVAVRAQTHYVVQKTEGNIPETTLEEVSGLERESEIARMLSGASTQASLNHARELLAGVSVA